MDHVQDAAQQHEGAGLLVVADEQRAGRGRRGHTWTSPPGAGIYFSLLLRPPVEASASSASPSLVGLITLAAGVAVARGIGSVTGLGVELKWPNDAFVSGRKLAGILAEGLAIGTPAQAIVLGVGINLRATEWLPEEVARRATSLEQELAQPVDRGEILAHVLVALAGVYECLHRAKYDEVLQAWRKLSPSSVGAQVEWNVGSVSHCGITAGIDDAGVLLVQTDAALERITGGALRWLGR